MNLSEISEFDLNSGKLVIKNREILDAFYKALSNSNSWDVMLGYLSLSAIKLLAYPLSKFIIQNSGKIRLYCNEQFSEKDYNTLIQSKEKFHSTRLYKDLLSLKNALSGSNSNLFIDCISYLIHNDLLEIKVLTSLDYGEGIAHEKNNIFKDSEGNCVVISGSGNASSQAFLLNLESADLYCSFWNETSTQRKIDEYIKEFEKKFYKGSGKYKILEIDSNEVKEKLEKVGFRKIDKNDLENNMLSSKKSFDNVFSKEIEEEIQLEIEKFIKEKKEPKFPHDQPYPYQSKAYVNWKQNDCTGLFEMATGTGKTLTAILCMIEEYKLSKVQKNIIVVPGKELVRQWTAELEGSNFQNIFTLYSENKKLKKEIQDIKTLKNVKNKNINIVITYDSFKDNVKFKNIFKDDFSDFIVIFDEAHNMGSIGFMKATKQSKFYKRIGLSATPFRDWDEQGSNDFISNFFGSEKPVFQFTMEEAIGRFLCNYNYFPYFCFLDDSEWNDYKKFTKQIPKAPKERTINQHAAMKRQAIIDKAFQKRSCVIKIIGKLLDDNNISNTLVYCPKGIEDSNEEDDKIIGLIADSVASNFDNINAQFFLGETENRDLLLEDFENQDVDILYAIKCLDEGVNVPSTQNAIFIASGKNKREFIQRRGRILRKFDGKTHANVYDIIVLPTNEQYYQDKNYSEKLLIGEFGRLIEFLEISINKIDSKRIIDEQLSQIELSYHKVKNLIKENEKTRDIEKYN